MENSPQLSVRQRQVLELLLQGKTNRQIAYALTISERTVEFHLRNIYAKHQVASRVELILKLGASTGGQLGYSPVVKLTHGLKMELTNRFQSVASLFNQEFDMTKRWLLYSIAGLIFGAAYWHYFSVTALFFNALSTRWEVNNLVWNGVLLGVALLTYFSVWLLPASLPAAYEYKHSNQLLLGALAVVVVWVSAVFGYYLNYLFMLAIIGLPHMEYLVVFGERSAEYWQNWATVFPRLILFNLIKWLGVGIIVGGTLGWFASLAAKYFLTKFGFASAPNGAAHGP